MSPARKPPITRRVEGLPIILVFICILALFMYTAPRVFLAPYIYITFLSTLPPLVLLAMGLTFVIAAGEIDLSFPAVIAFCGFTFAVLIKDYNFGWGAVVVTLAAGLLIGWINGLLIAVIGIPALITTLGTQFFWLGLATVVSGGKSYALRGVEETSVWKVFVGRPLEGIEALPPWLGDLPVQTFWMLAIVILAWFVLHRHRFGENVLFIGDSNAVSRVVGIDVVRERMRIFMLMGFLSALAAILLTLENKNYFGNQGQGYLLTAIASVLIGGTSIFGGRATIVGSIFGAMIIGMIEAGLVATGLTGSWVRTVQGLVFLFAIIFYFYADEPQRRQEFLARFRHARPGEGGRPAAGRGQRRGSADHSKGGDP